jgi:hypothetical protein
MAEEAGLMPVIASGAKQSRSSSCAADLTALTLMAMGRSPKVLPAVK